MELNYSEIPFFIEGDTPQTVEALSALAELISDKIQVADSDSRKILHLASVFACNFSNCLVGIADEILNKGGMDYHVLLPLLKQTVAKLENLDPAKAQTGPASRKDFNVMNEHIKMLESYNEVHWVETYKLLSNEIMTGKTDIDSLLS